VRGGFRNLRLDILPLWERAPQLLANGAVGLVRAGQSLDVGVPPNDCLYQDQFVCISCQKTGPVGDVLSLQDFTERDHLLAWYFEHQMTFEDEGTIRKAGASDHAGLQLGRILTWQH
jgi:hypothetical protein